MSYFDWRNLSRFYKMLFLADFFLIFIITDYMLKKLLDLWKVLLVSHQRNVDNNFNPKVEKKKKCAQQEILPAYFKKKKKETKRNVASWIIKDLQQPECTAGQNSQKGWWRLRQVKVKVVEPPNLLQIKS